MPTIPGAAYDFERTLEQLDVPELAEFGLKLGQLAGYAVKGLAAGGKSGELAIVMQLVADVGQLLHDLNEQLGDLREAAKTNETTLRISRISRLNWRLQAIKALFGEVNAEQLIEIAFKEVVGTVPKETEVTTQLDAAVARLEAQMEGSPDVGRELRSIRL